MLVKPRRAYHKTTDNHHRFRRHPNLLKEGPDQVRASASEQVWVADITYMPTDQGFVYLSLVSDAWSRKIVGHHVHDSLHTGQVSQALTVALKSRQTQQALVHHSDRGPVLLERLSGDSPAPRHRLLDDGRLRLLPERSGRARQRHPEMDSCCTGWLGAGQADGSADRADLQPRKTTPMQ